MIEIANQANHRRILDEQITCKPVCSGCCRRLVPVLVAEAILIYDHMKKRGHWEQVKQTAKDQLVLLKSDIHPIAWFKLNQACPLLESNLCMSHEIKPVSCSTHHVISSPELCYPWNTNSGKFELRDYNDLFEKFRSKVYDSLAGYGVLTLELPLPQALLFSERITIQSGIPLDKAISLILNEL